ncbi:MAG: ABC transporter substrate-binding protein, partial [Burkholderiaceae bacterium]|nr:ABC transporter substrate-binding protein [Burkholderiaceae bacterium]
MAGASGQVLAQPAPRTLVINISLEPDGLDPTSAPAASIGEVVHYNVLEGLTRIEESGVPSPLLA